MYRQPPLPSNFYWGAGEGGHQKLQKVMNTIMNKEIMNIFPKTFVQDCSFFPSSYACFFIVLKFSFLHHHHHKKHNLPKWGPIMYVIDHQHEKTKKEN